MSGQRISTTGHIAGRFFIVKILCDTQLLLWQDYWNIGRQHVGKLIQGYWYWERRLTA